MSAGDCRRRAHDGRGRRDGASKGRRRLAGHATRPRTRGRAGDEGRKRESNPRPCPAALVAGQGWCEAAGRWLAQRLDRVSRWPAAIRRARDGNQDEGEGAEEEVGSHVGAGSEASHGHAGPAAVPSNCARDVAGLVLSSLLVFRGGCCCRGQSDAGVGISRPDLVVSSKMTWGCSA